jgi:hypothetical protein
MTPTIHDVLDAALPSAPPSTVDLDRLIVRARRGARVRSLTFLTGGLAAVAVLALLVPQVVAGRSPGSSVGAPPTGSGLLMSTAELNRLAAAVQAGVRRIAPGLSVIQTETFGHPSPQAHVECDAAVGRHCPLMYEPVSYDLSYEASTDTGAGTLSVTVGEHGSMQDSCNPPPDPASPNPACQENVVSGDRILDLSSDVAHQQQVYLSLIAVHPDGTLVRIIVSPPVGSDTPALTKDQCVQLITDPALTLYP